MSKFAKTPRKELEFDIDVGLERVADLEATISQMRVDFEARLRVPIDRLHALRSELGQMQSELSKREAADNVEPSISYASLDAKRSSLRKRIDKAKERRSAYAHLERELVRVTAQMVAWQGVRVKANSVRVGHGGA